MVNAINCGQFRAGNSSIFAQFVCTNFVDTPIMHNSINNTNTFTSINFVVIEMEPFCFASTKILPHAVYSSSRFFVVVCVVCVRVYVCTDDCSERRTSVHSPAVARMGNGRFGHLLCVTKLCIFFSVCVCLRVFVCVCVSV